MKMRFLTQLFIACIIYNGSCIAKIPKNYTKIQCRLIAAPKSEGTNSRPHVSGPKSRRAHSEPTVSSLNWSGYAAEKNFDHPRKHSVRKVKGTWIVPELTQSFSDTFAAIWVGIDGFDNNTVEQIGVECDMIGGIQQNYAWFDMYPASAFVIAGFPVNPGDVMSASVKYIGKSIFRLTILNDTQQVYFTVPTSFTMSSKAQRDSAEWIVESPFLTDFLPLADFNMLYFWGCKAEIDEENKPLNNNKWENTPIEMVTIDGIPKAVPSPILPTNDSFFVTWQHM